MVEWFSASFPGASQTEVIDGIQVVRAGRQWTVHWHAFWRYRENVGRRFDTVIDEINTIPFFTPLWVGVPSFALILQLAREVWWYESRFPLNALGYALEPLYLSVYRHTPVFTCSASTASDLRMLDFKSDVNIVPVGIDQVDEPAHKKRTEQTFIYVGRLTPSKRVDHIIKAFAIFRSETRAGRLQLVGDGPKECIEQLRRLANRLGVNDSVEFCGWLPDHSKRKYMAQAHVLLMASVREGWGLVVTESNACGTPAVVYDVPGLRDSVRHGHTGLVVRPMPEKLAEGMLRLLQDPNEYQRLQRNALEWSKTFTYSRGISIIATRIGAARSPRDAVESRDS